MIYPEKDIDLDMIESDIAPKRVSYSMEDLNASQDSVFYKPVFEHFSSPKLSKLGNQQVERENRRSRSSDKSGKILKSDSRSPSIHRQASNSRSNSRSMREHCLSKSLLDLKRKYENELEALKAKHERAASRAESSTSQNGELDQSLMKKFYTNYRISKPESERSILRSTSSEFCVQRTPPHSSSVQKLMDRLDTIRVLKFL